MGATSHMTGLWELLITCAGTTSGANASTGIGVDTTTSGLAVTTFTAGAGGGRGITATMATVQQTGGEETNVGEATHHNRALPMGFAGTSSQAG